MVNEGHLFKVSGWDQGPAQNALLLQLSLMLTAQQGAVKTAWYNAFTVYQTHDIVHSWESLTKKEFRFLPPFSNPSPNSLHLFLCKIINKMLVQVACACVLSTLCSSNSTSDFSLLQKNFSKIPKWKQGSDEHVSEAAWGSTAWWKAPVSKMPSLHLGGAQVALEYRLGESWLDSTVCTGGKS